MKLVNWDSDKNRKLIEDRHISFEEIVFSLQSGGLRDDAVHPNSAKYPNQRVFIVALNEYAYLVPYVENDEEIFLKRLFRVEKQPKSILENNHEAN